MIGLVQVGDAAMADRYAYIPLIGIFAMIAFGIADWAEPRKVSPWPAIAAAILLPALISATHRQIAYWDSHRYLWPHALEVTENNFIAEDNLGAALILEGKEEGAHPQFESVRIQTTTPSGKGSSDPHHAKLREFWFSFSGRLPRKARQPPAPHSYCHSGGTGDFPCRVYSG